jgi:hypothetical protein
MAYQLRAIVATIAHDPAALVRAALGIEEVFGRTCGRTGP